jgi:hypothetical protein
MGRCNQAAAEMERRNREEERAEGDAAEPSRSPTAVAEFPEAESITAPLPLGEETDGWDVLARRFAPHEILTDEELSILLRNSRAIISASKKRLPDSGHSFASGKVTVGRTFEHIVAYARAHGIKAELLPAAHVLLDMTPAEAVDTATANTGVRGDGVTFDARLAKHVLGIPIEDWKLAAHEGRIRTPNGEQCSAHYVPAAAVVKAIEDGVFKPHYPAKTAARVFEQRRVAELERQDREREAARKPSLIDQAAEKAAELDAAEQLQAAEERATYLRHYRELLLRREDPQPGDAEFLGQILLALKLTPQHVKEDVAALEEIDRLAEASRQVVRLEEKVFEATRRVKEVEEAARTLPLLQATVASAYRVLGEARRAAHTIADIQAERPRLFDPPAGK